MALKFCLDPTAAAALRNEAGVLDRLMQHGRQPGVVPLQQTYPNADPPCLEYEYVEGGDLTGLIRELHAQHKLPPDAATRMLLQLAGIVASIHQANPPIVHDDLKPSNVLVRRGPRQELELNVTDFGIGGLAVARATRETRQPTTSREKLLTEAVRGAYTPVYASPQQMTRRRGEPADPRDDVHALGVIWYQLVTGDLTVLRMPADWTEELAKRALSEKLTVLMGLCLASKAEKRPADAGILAEQVRALTKRVTPPTPAEPPSDKWAAKPRNDKRSTVPPQRAVWILLSGPMLLAVLVGVFWVSRPASTPRADNDLLTNENHSDENKWPNGAPQPQKSQGYTNSIGMEFKWIEPGSFLMGSPDGKSPFGGPAEKYRCSDETPRWMRVTDGYYMGVYTVTKAQFAAFVQESRYQTEAEKAGDRILWRNPGFSKYIQSDNDPVVEVTLKDGVKFCECLSTKEGRTYLLPTEVQWEYACRAGTTTADSFGDDPELD